MENKEHLTTQEDIKKVMEYFSKIREIGAIDVFSRLLQCDFRVLTYLNFHENVHPSQIADDLRLSRPNVAANLRLLESKRYICRELDEENRRQVFVSITPGGRRYLQIVDQKCAALFKSWFSILGDEEVKHLFKILELSSNPQNITDEIKNVSFEE